MIFKLKPGMKYHDRAPVSGRTVSAEDIVKTQIHVRDNPRAQNSSFQTVSMQSVEAPDAQTVVFKLKSPNAYLFSDTQLASPSAQCIIPQETLDKLDEGWQIGSGPTEAECKTTTHRTKGRGRRWDMTNAEALMALAALDDSDLWNTHWQTFDPQNN